MSRPTGGSSGFAAAPSLAVGLAAMAATVVLWAGFAQWWTTELDAMRERLGAPRTALADALAHRTGTAEFAPLREQRGLFLHLPLTETQMGLLRQEHAVHGLPSGRINLAGIPTHRVDHVADAISRVHRLAAAREACTPDPGVSAACPGAARALPGAFLLGALPAVLVRR